LLQLKHIPCALGDFSPYTQRVHPENMFQHIISVTSDDIDFLGHASNITYVRWVQDVAMAHSAAVGRDVDAYRRLGAFFIIRRHEIDYLRPALRGDALQVRTWVDSVMAAKCERRTEIVNSETSTVVARATTLWGYVDAVTGRPTRIPDEVRVAFAVPPRARKASQPEVP